jgi:hypothetical protein
MPWRQPIAPAFSILPFSTVPFWIDRFRHVVHTAAAQPNELAEHQEWQPRLRQTARRVQTVRIDDQTTHEPALRVEAGRNKS